ncbi:MAG: methyltransferase [Devosia sp.]|nr:methyltransferase [Devosia sp.]
MSRHTHSSGNPIVDRRGAYAEALSSEHAYAEAAEVMAQALELAPDWAAGWNSLGRHYEGSGSIDRAIAAWQRSAELDPAGRYGAALKLAAHGVGGARGMSAYAETLFDDYAGRFEMSLVDRLGYRVPEALADMIVATGRPAGARPVDLGCGTGLMGVRLRPLVDRLEGVDLSQAMLAEARRKGIYDRLTRADLFDFLGGVQGVDLAAAADVLNYTGPLPPVLAAVRPVLSPGGRFAFSLETHGGPEPEVLRTSLRFAHHTDAALGACREAGYAVLATRAATLRYDRGEPVAGLLVVLAGT